jgi:phage terminase large subunit
MSHVVKLDRFVPRQYQQHLIDAFEKRKDLRRFMVVWPRRAGKDVCALNLLLRAAFRRVGTYFYVFPTFSMGRRILWDAIDISGNKILSYYIPNEIVESRNEQQMRIRLCNGSQIQILGSDDVDKSLVGTNAVGIVFSEYALQDPRAWSLSLPILKASDGWALFCSTVRGKNHFYDLYNVAKDSDSWFCEKLTVEDTKHVSVEEIEKEIADGQISRDLAMQEFWNDWSLGVEGSYYGKYIDDLRRKNQITLVPWEPYLPVHTAWDLGYNDPTTIIFFQVFNNQVRVIDCYENNKKGLDHYARILKEKEYAYGKHIAPFDIAVHDLSTGTSRWQMMKELGITFIRYSTKAPSIDDGIEIVRKTLPRLWIDEKNCASFIKSVENYRQEYDHKKRIYKSSPLHDDSSHWSDALRYMCVGLPLVITTNNPQDIQKRYDEAVLGVDSTMPKFFQSNNEQFPGY